MENEISESTIYEQLRGFPEQIEYSMNINLPEIKKINKVCVCGMGASALAGEILADYINETSERPIFVIRGIELPGWVDEDTTSIVISYSGNTKEMLIAYEEAKKRNSQIIVISAGGELSDICEEDNNLLIKLPPGFQSRGAFGHMLGSLMAVLDKLEICNSIQDTNQFIHKLKKQRDRLSSPDNKLIKDISAMLIGKIPVIYALANMRSSAIRWKTQINENSKLISFCGSLPEFNHNEIVGWTDDQKNSTFVPIILYDDDASTMVRCMTDASIEILESRNLNLISYHVSGKNNLEKNLKCSLLGDFVSLKLADYCEADPTENTSVRSVNNLIIIKDSE